MTNITKTLLGSVAALALVGSGTIFALTAGAADKPAPAIVDFAAGPVFPDAKTVAAVKVADQAPKGAQYRVRSGKSGVRYVACNEARTYAGGAVELHCLSFSKSKGWGKSLRWIPKYQLAPLTGPMPAEPVATAAR